MYAYNIDGNTHALNEYMDQLDRDYAAQERIDALTAEMIEEHTADITDMVVCLIEEYPDRAIEVLTTLLSSGVTTNEAANEVTWFKDKFIPDQCELIAKELANED